MTKKPGDRGQGQLLALVQAAALSDSDACIEVTGRSTRPNVRWNGRTSFASRVAWQIRHGQPVPAGKNVCHTCDNEMCVNGSHLYVGTQSQNVQDEYDRGRRGHVRTARGERVGTAKLTDDQIREIRRRHTGKRGDGARLAEEFGVTRTMISYIVRGKSWAHL